MHRSTRIRGRESKGEMRGGALFGHSRWVGKGMKWRSGDAHARRESQNRERSLTITAATTTERTQRASRGRSTIREESRYHQESREGGRLLCVTPHSLKGHTRPALAYTTAVLHLLVALTLFLKLCRGHAALPNWWRHVPARPRARRRGYGAR